MIGNGIPKNLFVTIERKICNCLNRMENVYEWPIISRHLFVVRVHTAQCTMSQKYKQNN